MEDQIIIKIDENQIRVTQMVPQETIYTKEQLLERKSNLEARLNDINNLLAQFN